MFRIKVCGVTSPEDAVLAIEAGADAVGINFFRGSPRFVPPSLAQPIVEALGKRATAVAVFVDEAPEKIAAVCEELGIGIVQLSGRELAELAARIRVPVIKAVHMEGGSVLDTYRDYPCIGGPFIRFGRDRSSVPGRPWMLAGGLTPGNVTEAIRSASPFGVDVASGVEAAPGKKDPGKLKAFVKSAREGFGIAGIDG
jgi:phosphoribosylanthranilate isomerase